MRNYRIIAKQNNMGAWGSGRSQVISPIKDSIKFELQVKSFTAKDNIPIISDSVILTKYPLVVPFILKDEIVIGLDDSINIDI